MTAAFSTTDLALARRMAEAEAEMNRPVQRWLGQRWTAAKNAIPTVAGIVSLSALESSWVTALFVADGQTHYFSPLSPAPGLRIRTDNRRESAMATIDAAAAQSLASAYGAAVKAISAAEKPVDRQCRKPNCTASTGTEAKPPASKEKRRGHLASCRAESAAISKRRPVEHRTRDARFALVLLVVLLAQPGGASEVHARKIDLAEAPILVCLCLQEHNAGVELTNCARAFDPDFYFFAATWDNPSGSPIVGYFAVNPSTGDVWRPAGHCERVTSPALEKRQREIRKRFGFKRREYERLKRKTPLCDAG